MDPITLSYKQIGDTSIQFDIYPPSTTNESRPYIPAVIYFHGGGLTAGNRKSWLPIWLLRRATEAGYAFISADYQLLPPATGHDIVADIKDLFRFLSSDSFSAQMDVVSSTGAETNGYNSLPFRIDMDEVAVAGTSAGGLIAYLAAMHISPKPKAILSFYGLGGNFMTAHYVLPKLSPFFRGRDLLEPSAFSQYIYPFPTSHSATESLKPISDSELEYHPNTSATPGYPANPRMLLARLYLQLGLFLDYYTGQHEPSLSIALREALNKKVNAENVDSIIKRMRQVIPESHLPLFPQFGVNSDWPPTLLWHGESDTAVPVHESRYMKASLDRAGVPDVRLIVIEGKEHNFDYDPNAEALYGKHFDLVADFLKVWLKPRAG